MDVDALAAHRSEHDLFLAEHYASPLPEEHQEDFAGADYFPPASDWVIAGTFHPGDLQPIPIPSTSGTESDYTKVGEVTLEIDGAEYRLVVIDDGDGKPYIPFRDDTAGDTTYPGGRWVGIEVADEFICPLAPPSNVIAAPVTAGEKWWRPPA